MELKALEPSSVAVSAASAALYELKVRGRATVVMPRRTGLRQVAVEVQKLLGGGLTVVLVPRASDCVATLSQMARLSGVEVACIVTERRQGWKEVYTSGSYLEDHGLPVMYNVSQVLEFLFENEQEKASEKVIFCARGGYPLLRSALRQRNQQVDLLICEFLLRTTMNQRAASSFEDIFDDDYIPCRHRLFLSSSTAVYQLHNKRPKHGIMSATALRTP